METWARQTTPNEYFTDSLDIDGVQWDMAKPSPASSKRATPTIQHVVDVPTKRKGVHAKSGSSQLKTSKKYKKPYRGQGR